MILKALYDYYYRMMELNPMSLPMYGFQNATISFVIIIKKDGSFVRIEDCRDNNKKGREYVLPKGNHTNSTTPFLFWDNCLYAINYSKANKPLNEIERQDAGKVAKWEKSLKTAQEKHLAFVKRCKKVWKETHEPEFESVVKFYEKNQISSLKQDILWAEIEKNPIINISFRIEGNTRLVSENKSLVKFVEEDDEKQGTCLVTGNHTNIVRTSTRTPLVGCKSSASLVSFQTDSGYDSYGKSQCYNAPISIEADFAYSTAFLKLKAQGSRNKFLVGNRTFLFWASSNSEAAEQAEGGLFDLLGMTGQDDDDPNARVEQVRKVFKAIDSGSLRTTLDDRFYILGLAPNSARIAVIYWSETSLKDFAGMIIRHFNDMEIVQDNKGQQKFYRGLNDMLSGVTRHNNDGKWKDNITPNLPEAIVKSIFQGYPYPFTLFSSCIRRIQAESADKNSVYAVRAAIIKAYLNRLNDNNKKILTMLDKENTNPGYLCGRLFAILDKIQEDANHISSIRERYMNAASATPATVFATILNLSVHHAEKLNEGSKVFYEKLKQEIICKLPADAFPTHLDLQEQGRFFVGYYHQRQELFLKKDNQNE
jgi:CRISPR-associated protein Csd1